MKSHSFRKTKHSRRTKKNRTRSVHSRLGGKNRPVITRQNIQNKLRIQQQQQRNALRQFKPPVNPAPKPPVNPVTMPKPHVHPSTEPEIQWECGPNGCVPK